MAFKKSLSMSARQCEIAAEAYTACLLAQAGYDVLVQYGANQPNYDLVANREARFLPVSVKGSQDGGWMLAVRFKQPGVTYHQAIDKWLGSQRHDVTFFLVQFFGVPLGAIPRVYIAGPQEIATQLKAQCDGRGYGALQENVRSSSPGSRYSHRIPEKWLFSRERLETELP